MTSAVKDIQVHNCNGINFRHSEFLRLTTCILQVSDYLAALGKEKNVNLWVLSQQSSSVYLVIAYNMLAICGNKPS